MPFISLCLKPTCLILLDDKLEVKTGVKFICSSKPSRFAYPLLKSEENKEKKERNKKKDVLSVQKRIDIRKAIREGNTGDNKVEKPELKPENEAKIEEEKPVVEPE